MAAGQHLVGEDGRLYTVSGNEPNGYVHHNNMHVHGYRSMGSSASNANKTKDLTRTSVFTDSFHVRGVPSEGGFLCDRNRQVDRDGRPHQFAVITVLGGTITTS